MNINEKCKCRWLKPPVEHSWDVTQIQLYSGTLLQYASMYQYSAVLYYVVSLPSVPSVPPNPSVTSVPHLTPHTHYRPPTHTPTPTHTSTDLHRFPIRSIGRWGSTAVMRNILSRWCRLDKWAGAKHFKQVVSLGQMWADPFFHTT